MSSNIMDRLRSETSEQHKSAEARPLEQALVKGAVGRDTFVRYLEQRFLIHQSLDAAVMNLCAKDLRFEGLVTEELLQLPNLRQDLEFFGSDVNAIRPCETTTAYIAELDTLGQDEPVALLGGYYVFEGSKNGARYIARALRHGLALNGEEGMRYLDPHGERQRELWQAFRERMGRADIAPAEQDAMVAFAKRTFDAVSAIDDEIAEVSIASPNA